MTDFGEMFTVTSAELPSPTYRFPHQAMATTFEILICGHELDYARQAAWSIFAELDHLEEKLSRFIPGSDISRINDLSPDQRLRIGLETFECLEFARKVFLDTSGAFDVTVGPLYTYWHSLSANSARPSAGELDEIRRRVGMDLLQINPSDHSVAVETDGIMVDLGGIGKGYAVDRIVELLRDWSIETALIYGGQSTIYALGTPPGCEGWPLTLHNHVDPAVPLEKVFLANYALSGSGRAIKGQHIIDPRLAQPAENALAAWSLAPTAACADALSTAFMVFSVDEVDNYCRCHPDVSAVLVLPEKDEYKVRRFGRRFTA